MTNPVGSSDRTWEPLSWSGHPLNILIVEDNRINQRVAEKFMKKACAASNVTIAENGQVALDAVQKTQFDLILMDDRMPVMDGIEATRRIREYERKNWKKRTPIIGCYVHAYNDGVKNGIDSGMDYVLCKPLRYTDILEKSRLALLDADEKSLGEADGEWVIVDGVEDWEVVEWGQ